MSMHLAGLRGGERRLCGAHTRRCVKCHKRGVISGNRDTMHAGLRAPPSLPAEISSAYSNLGTYLSSPSTSPTYCILSIGELYPSTLASTQSIRQRR